MQNQAILVQNLQTMSSENTGMQGSPGQKAIDHSQFQTVSSNLHVSREAMY